MFASVHPLTKRNITRWQRPVKEPDKLLCLSWNMHLWSDKMLSYLLTFVYIYKYQKWLHMSFPHDPVPRGWSLGKLQHRDPMAKFAHARIFRFVIKITGNNSLRTAGKKLFVFHCLFLFNYSIKYTVFQ